MSAPHFGQAGEGFQEGSAGGVRCWSKGDGEPVVHLHGGPGPMLTRAHDLLSERFRVIALEMPGFGGSPVNGAIGSAQDMAGVLWPALDALGLERLNLIGSSIGGKVALCMAIQRPERLSALVLESPAAIRPETHSPDKIPPQEIPRRAFAHPDKMMPLMLPPDPAVRQKVGPVMARLSGADREPELERQMREVEVPTLVLFGMKDGLVPPEMGRIYRELLPNCAYVLVYDAAHAIQEERPEAFAKVVGDFLSQHEAFILNRASALLAP